MPAPWVSLTHNSFVGNIAGAIEMKDERPIAGIIDNVKNRDGKRAWSGQAVTEVGSVQRRSRASPD
jgi:hypothetical protein